MRHMMRRLYVDALCPTTWNEFLPIDADHGDRGIGCLRHGLLLVFGAPCQLRLLAGQERDRTWRSKLPLPPIDHSRKFSNPAGRAGVRKLLARNKFRTS